MGGTGLDNLSPCILAAEMIKRMARISVVHDETDIPRGILRRAYVDINGVSPSKGSVKHSSKGVCEGTRVLKKECAAFSVIYGMSRKVRGDGNHARLLMAAYDMFKSLRKNSILDFTGAWVIARDLDAGDAFVGSCPDCSSAVLNWPGDMTNCLICRAEIAG